MIGSLGECLIVFVASFALVVSALAGIYAHDLYEQYKR